MNSSILTTLAFSIYSNKGAYALLLGAGISKASGLPSGWDIVTDLLKKLAAQNMYPIAIIWKSGLEKSTAVRSVIHRF